MNLVIPIATFEFLLECGSLFFFHVDFSVLLHSALATEG